MELWWRKAQPAATTRLAGDIINDCAADDGGRIHFVGRVQIKFVSRRSAGRSVRRGSRRRRRTDQGPAVN